MKKFSGFTSDETFTKIPDAFFRDILPNINDADELKVTLHALWRIANMEGRVHVLRTEDFAGLVPEPEPALKKAVTRGTVIRVARGRESFYFLNSPRGRASAEAFAKGQTDISSAISAAPVERPNIFKLYEANIGPLTPLIADMLKAAEKDYPNGWFEEAFDIAVARNVRNWKYVEAILKRWKDKGKDERKNKQDAGKDFKRYTEGEFAEFFKRD
jgi:DNA replication protein